LGRSGAVVPPPRVCAAAAPAGGGCLASGILVEMVGRRRWRATGLSWVCTWWGDPMSRVEFQDSHPRTNGHLRPRGPLRGCFPFGVHAQQRGRARALPLGHARLTRLPRGRVWHHTALRGQINGIAINQFWQVHKGLWPLILFFIAVPETFRTFRGWM